jgi:hypothetical protein
MIKSHQKAKNTKYEDQNFPQIEGDEFSIYAA